MNNEIDYLFDIIGLLDYDCLIFVNELSSFVIQNNLHLRESVRNWINQKEINKYLLKNDNNTDKKSINKDINLFNITFWDTSMVNCMYSIFKDYEYFDELLLWNTRNVDNMALMFCNAKSFNKPLNNWDVRNVREMYSMFSIAINFNQKLNNWKFKFRKGR